MTSHVWIIGNPIAHRGYHDMNQHIWENSISAFKRAIEVGLPIECDLRLSVDNVVIVIHDAVTQRLCGIDGNVREMTAENLRSLHIGRTSDRISSLSDILRLVEGKVGLILELKPQDDMFTDIFAQKVLEDLHGYHGKVALMSFDRRLVENLLKANSPWPVGFVAKEKSETDGKKNMRALELDLNFISFCVHDLPSQFVAAARAKDLPVITWTVTDQSTREATYKYADQMTFEGFDPLVLPD